METEIKVTGFVSMMPAKHTFAIFYNKESNSHEFIAVQAWALNADARAIALVENFDSPGELIPALKAGGEHRQLKEICFDGRRETEVRNKALDKALS